MTFPRPRINFRLIFWILFYFFLFGLLLRGSFAYLDPDLGWHLKVGQEIAATRSIPHQNHYNYTFIGDWVDHEWLSNLGLYRAYDSFGYPALAILFSLLIVAVLIGLNIWARRLVPAASLFGLASFQFLGVVAILPHSGVRIQELGIVFVFAVLLLTYSYNKKPARIWPLLFLPPLMYLWACLHASFLIGFFILGAWVAVKAGEKILARFWPRPWLDLSGVLPGKSIWLFSAATLLAFVATLFTPYKSGLYSFLLGYRDTYYLTHIQEWLPQWSFPFQYGQLFYLALAAVALFLYIHQARRREGLSKIDLWALFLILVFAVLSFKSRRHFPLFFVVSFVFMIRVYCSAFYLPEAKGKWRLHPSLKLYLLACLAFVSVWQLVQTRFIAEPFRAFCADYPCGAADFLAQRPEYNNLNIFNHYAWGGYLIWQLPERKLFIDGRLPQVAFAGHTFLEEYYEFYQAPERVAEKLAQYDIRLVLLPASDKPTPAAAWEKFIFRIKDEDLKADNKLRKYLLSSREWQPVYSDAASVIYIKH